MPRGHTKATRGRGKMGRGGGGGGGGGGAVWGGELEKCTRGPAK